MSMRRGTRSAIGPASGLKSAEGSSRRASWSPKGTPTPKTADERPRRPIRTRQATRSSQSPVWLTNCESQSLANWGFRMTRSTGDTLTVGWTSDHGDSGRDRAPTVAASARTVGDGAGVARPLVRALADFNRTHARRRSARTRARHVRGSRLARDRPVPHDRSARALDAVLAADLGLPRVERAHLRPLRRSTRSPLLFARRAESDRGRDRAGLVSFAVLPRADVVRARRRWRGDPLLPRAHALERSGRGVVGSLSTDRARVPRASGNSRALADRALLPLHRAEVQRCLARRDPPSALVPAERRSVVRAQ